MRSYIEIATHKEPLLTFGQCIALIDAPSKTIMVKSAGPKLPLRYNIMNDLNPFSWCVNPGSLAILPIA